MSAAEDLGVFTVDDLLSELRHRMEIVITQVGEVLAGTTDSVGGMLAASSAEVLMHILQMLQERAWPMEGQ